MSTHNICLNGVIRKILLFIWSYNDLVSYVLKWSPIRQLAYLKESYIMAYITNDALRLPEN